MVDGDFTFYSFRQFNNNVRNFIDKIILLRPFDKLRATEGQVYEKAISGH